MRTTVRRTLGIAITGGALLAGTAVAADPESGTVSNASPKVQWTGEVTGSFFNRYPVVATEDDGVPCEAPSCDTFALTVADKGNLTLTADIAQPEDNPGSVTLRVRQPDGSTVISSGDNVSEGKPHKFTIKNAATGDYAVEYYNNFVDGPIGYTATASLPATAPAPAPGEPAPAPTPSGPASPPAPTSFSLTVKPAKTSARRANRSRKAFATVTSDREISVQAALKKGSRTVGKGAIAKLNGKGKLALKLSRKLKAGKYKLTVAGRDAAGTTVVRTVAVKVRK